MPKRTTSKQNTHRLARLNAWMGGHPVKAILLLLVLVLIMWALTANVVKAVRIHHQRAQFMQAKVDLDSLYNAIVAKVGPPAAHKETQTCSYTSAEWSKGYLSCDIAVYIFYTTPSQGSAGQIAGQIQHLVRSVPDLRRPEQLPNEWSEDTYQIANYKVESSGLKDCGIVYNYQNEKSHTYYPGADKEAGLVVSTICSGSALKEYFPVVNQ